MTNSNLYTIKGKKGKKKDMKRRNMKEAESTVLITVEGSSLSTKQYLNILLITYKMCNDFTITASAKLMGLQLLPQLLMVIYLSINL